MQRSQLALLLCRACFSAKSTVAVTLEAAYRDRSRARDMGGLTQAQVKAAQSVQHVQERNRQTEKSVFSITVHAVKNLSMQSL